MFTVPTGQKNGRGNDAGALATTGCPDLDPVPFSLAQVDLLPAAVRDWLAHSIAVGTPLWRSAELPMRAEIRLGRWRWFTARQILAPPAGLIWAATAWMGALPVAGHDLR